MLTKTLENECVVEYESPSRSPEPSSGVPHKNSLDGNPNGLNSF
jgi:hypothetical protein